MPANMPENPLKEIKRDERSIKCLISVRVSSGEVYFSMIIESTLCFKARIKFEQIQILPEKNYRSTFCDRKPTALMMNEHGQPGCSFQGAYGRKLLICIPIL